VLSYLVVAFKNPGIIESQKLIRSPAVHSTEPQSIDFSHGLPLTEPMAQKKLAEKQSEPKEIEDENSGPISISALGKNPVIHDSDEEQEPPGRVSIEIAPAPDESSIHIEVRFCTKCTIEQPLRAKHCRYCDVCVAVYDHHCPWMGNCVGERNRFNFWWYLLFEFIVICWTAGELMGKFESEEQAGEWIKMNWMVLLAMSVCVPFGAMVGFLLVFHSYLAAANKTTWEQLSWEKISYLSKWPKKMGSPFSKGVLKNLVHYCCKPLPKGYTMWNFPTKVPM
jgi:hypothetical protein